jgi:serine phosphatase RsbU (regulator of sigma subunit)
MLRQLTRKVATESWRAKLSLRTVITWSMATAVLTASLVAGYYALTVLYQNKLVDTWAIMYLELEHQGTILTNRLLGESRGLGALDADDAVVKVDGQGRVQVIQGGFGPKTTLSDFGLDAKTFSNVTFPPHTVLVNAGEPFLARRTGSGILLRKVDGKTFVLTPDRPADEGALYLMTREGRLLFSNNTAITETSMIERELVQNFIKAPIKQGQLELTNTDGEAVYGFFAEIPRTNIVMFSEVLKTTAMSPVKRIVMRFLGVLALVLVGAVILIQLVLSRITHPVKELAELARSVGQGRFDVAPTHQGFGELAVLSSAFSSMATGLVERDRRVAFLMESETEKARLAGELAIAQRIQENLLPAKGLPEEAGLKLATEYIPAAECAGDWYHFAYDPAKRETVVVLADVSGHGAGSSIFTAIIAGLFDEFRSRDDSAFDMRMFAKRTNDVIFRLGRRQWHVTMVIARYVAGQDELELLLAGHPHPLLKLGLSGETGMVMPPLGSSTILGNSLDFSAAYRKVPFKRGTTLLMYTDGLSEAVNVAGKAFGRRRVRDCFLAKSGDPRETLNGVVDDWRRYLDKSSPGDDVCAVVMRAT